MNADSQVQDPFLIGDSTRTNSENLSSTQHAKETIKAQIADQELTQEYKEQKGEMRFWLKISANLTKISRVEQRAQEIELAQDQETTLSAALDSVLDKEAKALQLVFERSQPKWQRLASLAPKASKALQDPKVAASLAVVGAGLWVGFKSGAISSGIRMASRSIAAINPILGIVGTTLGGAAAGYITEGIKAKEQEFSTKNWLKQENLAALASIKDATTAKELETSQLSQLVGIIENAIIERKVRGNLAETLAFVTKLQYVQQELARRESENTDLTMAAIDGIEQGTQATDQAIIASAAKEQRDLYEEILQGKESVIRDRMIQGAIRGGKYGFVAGLAVGGLGLIGGSTAEAQETAEQLNKQYEIHKTALDKAQNSSSDTLLRGFGYDPNNHIAYPTSADKYLDPNFILGNTNKSLLDYIRDGNVREAIKIANLHNIGLDESVFNGQELFEGDSFAEHLIANKEDFLKLSIVQQWEVISHPELAEKIMNADNLESLKTLFGDADMRQVFLNMPKLTQFQVMTGEESEDVIRNAAALINSPTTAKINWKAIGINVATGVTGAAGLVAAGIGVKYLVAWRRFKQAEAKEKREQAHKVKAQGKKQLDEPAAKPNTKQTPVHMDITDLLRERKTTINESEKAEHSHSVVAKNPQQGVEILSTPNPDTGNYKITITSEINEGDIWKTEFVHIDDAKIDPKGIKMVVVGVVDGKKVIVENDKIWPGDYNEVIDIKFVGDYNETVGFVRYPRDQGYKYGILFNGEETEVRLNEIPTKAVFDENNKLAVSNHAGNVIANIQVYRQKPDAAKEVIKSSTTPTVFKAITEIDLNDKP